MALKTFRRWFCRKLCPQMELRNSELKKQENMIFCCEGHLASGCAVMSTYFFRNYQWGAPASIFGGKIWAARALSGTNTVTMKLTKKTAVTLSDHTPITYLLSTSLASCIWKMDSGVIIHTLYVIIDNSQHYKKTMLIVIRFNPSRSFFCRDLLIAA